MTWASELLGERRQDPCEQIPIYLNRQRQTPLSLEQMLEGCGGFEVDVDFDDPSADDGPTTGRVP